MTLAAILLVSIFSAFSARPLVARPPIASQITLASATPATPAKQGQSSAQTAQNPAASSQPPSSPVSPAQTSPTHSTPTAKRPHHKKRVRPTNCGTMPAAVGQAASGSASAPGDPAPATAPAPAAASPSRNCPPPKVIVRQGGTSEPSIQLAGGAPAAQTSNQRDTANQMLDTTEANLKKIAGKPLSSNQQDMVSQTRQFMQESKAAVEAGDLERARTLAWKAQVLSEELIKPGQ